MSTLPDILSSRTRAELFRLLFTFPEAELYVREIQRRTGLNDRAIRQELDKLSRLGLVTPRRDGNRLYYKARKDHPLFPDIRNLTLKTSGLADVLRERLDVDGVQIAFVFGSIANGSEKADSDIDLMVIGRVRMRELTRLLSGASEQLSREINPHILTLEEYRKRFQAKEHFLNNVLSNPKIMIKGAEDELERLGAQ
ncbi:MAG TPA: nucleotidyltransferase domain-containing protein [Candidatus Hydrogenedentes bacterium]|nr:nucleotidyltransferase domain-containing protein [Candidatus Hydrogenedentota bacterium]